MTRAEGGDYRELACEMCRGRTAGAGLRAGSFAGCRLGSDLLLGGGLLVVAVVDEAELAREGDAHGDLVGGDDRKVIA